MVGDFEFTILSNWKGYNSSRDKTNLDPEFLIRGSKNTYKKLSGNIASRPGLKTRGSVDTTVAGVKSGDTWNTSLGTVIPWRVANNKLQVEFDIVTPGTFVWYDLLITSTLTNPAASLTRFVADTWWDNTEKKDRIIWVRGDSNLLHWSGGIAIVASSTSNTITKTGTTTWAQAGFATNTAGEKKVIISGSEFTYTGGESTTTLTGVTPNATNIAVGAVAIQAVIVETDKPAAGFDNDFIKTIGNQLWVGSYTSRLVYISDDSDFKNFTVPTPTSPGDPELLTLDNAPTCITVRQGNGHISAGTSDWYEIVFEVTTLTNLFTGATSKIRSTKVNKKPVSVLSAALAHEFVDTVGDDIVYLAKDQQLRVLGTFRNINQPKYPSLSQSVYDELADEDFTGGHLKAIGDFIYITAPVNGRDWMHQTREGVNEQGDVVAERLWHPPQIRNVSRFTVISGVIFGHSNANPMIYQIWDTNQWHDDGPSGEPIPYTCVMKTAYQNGKLYEGLIGFDKTFFEGYITSGVDLNANIYMDYQGASGIQQVNINSIASPVVLFSGVTPPTLGSSSLGDNPLGDGIVDDPSDQELLAKFRSMPNCTVTDVFEFTIEVFTTDPDCRWEIERMGTNIKQTSELAVFLQK